MDKWIKLLAESNFTKDVTTAFLPYEMTFQMGHKFSYLDLWYSEVKEEELFRSGEQIIAEWEM